MGNPLFLWFERMEKLVLPGAIPGYHVAPNPIAEVDAYSMPERRR
jgi:hypothetical protein